MKIYEKFDIQDKISRTITIGNFDGLHKGHQKLIEMTKEISKKSNTQSCILTFKANTNIKLNNQIKYISSYEQRLSLIENTGIDELFVIEFTQEIKNTKTYDFIKDILVEKLNVKNLVLGDDAILGSDRLKVDQIKEVAKQLGVNLYTIDEVIIDGKRVTSSLIRDMITRGIVGEEIEKYLGHKYYFEGTVIHGNNFGNKIGYPTANINVDKNLIMPRYGVYKCKVLYNDRFYKAALNIGNKPSVENSYFSVEVFLIDFNDDIYNKNIRIYLEKHLRDEVKFASIDQLKSQIKKDVEFIKNYS